jgi:ribonuclease P protein component
MLKRLRGRKTNERVLKKGQVCVGKHIRAHYLFEEHVDALHVGMRTPVQLHKLAVKRNRMRRRCREALRVVIQHNQKIVPVLLLLTPKSSSLTVPFLQLQQDVELLLITLSTYYERQKK